VRATSQISGAIFLAGTQFFGIGDAWDGSINPISIAIKRVGTAQANL